MNNKNYSLQNMFKIQTIYKSCFVLLLLVGALMSTLQAENSNSSSSSSFFSKVMLRLRTHVIQSIDDRDEEMLKKIKPSNQIESSLLNAACGMDVFFINDQSGSVDAIENRQSRTFISAMTTRVGNLGTANDASRFSISEYAHTNTWYHYSFASAGTNYTTEVSDVLLYEYAPRTLTGGTSIYRAMQEAQTAVRSTPVSGRTVPKVVVLMTDAFCFQIEPTSLNIAQELKDDGYYIVVMAIGPATACSDLNTIASPGGYFSAVDYQTLENNVISLVESIFTTACTNAPVYNPSYNLSVAITSFTASGCNTPPGTFSADYTVSNIGDAAYNANLKIAFYDNSPTSPTSNHLITIDAGTQSISSGGAYMGTVTDIALESANLLFAVVNIDGTIGQNTVPLTFALSSGQLNENTEEITADNFSSSFTRVNDVNCAPQAKINVDVTTTGVTCGDKVTYEVNICNTGDAAACIDFTPYAGTGFTLLNSDISANSLTYGGPIKILQQQTIQANSDELFSKALKTSDGGFLLGGFSISSAGSDKTTGNFGDSDMWIVKLDASLNVEWDSTFGSTQYDVLNDMNHTSDGGFIVAGRGIGGINGNKTVTDEAWILKFDASGNLMWQGGVDSNSSLDEVKSIEQTSDGGYILAIRTTGGLSGDKTHLSYGSSDYWIVKLDASGNFVWDQAIGGSSNDIPTNIIQVSDGSYIVTGYSNSPADGNKTATHYGNYDYFVVKLDAVGNIIWQNSYGGSGYEAAGQITETSDGDFLLTGSSASTTDGNKTAPDFGINDYYLLKIDGSGNIIWQNTYGGSGNDVAWVAETAVELSNGDIIINGHSTSPISGNKTEGVVGAADYWTLGLTSTGDILWQKVIGGTSADNGIGLVAITENRYLLLGYSDSNIGGDKTESSLSKDYWVVEIETCRQLTQGECLTLQYTYDVSGASAGNYDFSMAVTADSTDASHGKPSIHPDENFSVGATMDLNGFDGAVHTSDDVTVAPVAACPSGDLLSIAVDIPDNTVCEDGYTTATVTITNNSGGIFSNIDIALDLTGTGIMYASEPYNLTNGLVLPSVNTIDPSYPAVDNALYNGSGMDTLDIYTLPNGTSTFAIDLEIGTGLANLSTQLLNIPAGYNSTNESNIGTDATGITGEANPTINGTCPGSITSATASISLNYTVTGATTIQWVSGTSGTFSAPNSGTSDYTVNATDIANGFVDLSIIASTANNCQTVENCRVSITGVTYDYGDAPASYDLNETTIPVAAAATLLTDLYLGTTAPDTEGTTSANADATGDGADEDAMDGVSLTKPASGATGYTIPVEVTNNSAETAYLTAFIDWNADGDFLDTLESSTQITIAASSGVTTQNTSFDVPNITINDDLFLRLRLSTDNRAANVPYGAAAQGEVEDALIFCSTDSDGDGICDNVDIDDDNDGIRDVDEGYPAAVGMDTDSDGIDDALDTDCDGSVLSADPGGNAASIHAENSIGGAGSAAAIGSDNSRAVLNATADFLVMDLGLDVPAGTIIEVEARVTNNLHEMSIDESADASSFTNLQNYTWGSTSSEETKQYTLAATARYIRIQMSVDNGTGAVQVDNVAYQAFNVLVCDGVIGMAPTDTDMDGTPDYLDLDSDGDGCYDKTEAGVTGFTNTGLVTDSLAATTAAEVGNNGLDNDIESDDTQAATTSGSYTITQTYGGTNDFQNAAVYSPACPCLPDSDGDGVCDEDDIDDDNDGILDTDECSEEGFATLMDLSTIPPAFYSYPHTFPLNPSGPANLPLGGVEVSITAALGSWVKLRGYTPPAAAGTSFDHNGINVALVGDGRYLDLLADNGGTFYPVDLTLAVNFGVSANALVSGASTYKYIIGIAGQGGVLEQFGTVTSNVTLTKIGDIDVFSTGAVSSLNGVQNPPLGATGTIIATPIPEASTGYTFFEIPDDISTLEFVIDDSFGTNPSITRNEAFGFVVGVIEIVCDDTDGDGTPDHLDLDSDGDGCYDKIEAGVTGFTTNGSVTDSLAATTAGEVGMNGLDDDIESDDMQAATTAGGHSGAYTITQTNTGTNDFENGSVQAPDCPCVKIDSDGDGICDAIDIDDDNDGILDIDEQETYVNCVEDVIFYENGGNINTFNPVTGVETVYATIDANIQLNALAVNTDLGGLVYGYRTTDASEIVVYDPTLGTWSSVGMITGANFSSGGGTYYNGVLYFANNVDAIYAITLSTDGKSIVSSNLFSSSFTGSGTGNWGDIAVGTGCNGNPTLFGSPSTGDFLYAIDLTTATPTGNVATLVGGTVYPGQLAVVNGILYGNSTHPSTDLYRINVCTGALIDTGFDLGAAPLDLGNGVSTCNYDVDTDMDGIVDRLDLDSDGDGCYDKIEAGVTGFTTNGSVTDSLAATSAAQVGTNGLDDDIESDDTQAATTAGGHSGAYTITQTTSGINDFQYPGLLSSACPCNALYPDSDNDGICDVNDIDDDNDGIRDIDECSAQYVDLSTAIVTIVSPSSAVISGISLGGVNNGTLAITGINGGQLYTGGATGGINTLLDNDYDNTSIFTPFGSNSEYSINSEIDDLNPGDSVEFVLTFNQPIEEFTLHVLNVDLADYQFTGNHKETYLSGGTEFDFNPITRIWTDTNPNSGSVSNVTRDGYGSIRISPLDNSIGITQIRWRRIENPANDGSSSGIDGNGFTFSAVDCDTDNDGITDNLDLDSDGDGCYDKIEAGVTGFTTNGSVTDSLAATTAGEVGANGLDDDIESDDTPAATTIGGHLGAYTITQTNGGTNDFQDAAINDACNVIPPYAVNDTTTTNQGIAVTFNLLLNDTTTAMNVLRGDSVQFITPPTQGMATYTTADSSVTYTPTGTYSGLDSLQYRVCDTLGLCDTAWAFINISPNILVEFTDSIAMDDESIGGNLPTLTVSGGVLTAASTIELVLNSSPGTATTGVDYAPNFGSRVTVTIPVGDYTVPQIIVLTSILSITDDNIAESDETFSIDLSNPQSSSNQLAIGDADSLGNTENNHVYTIVDGDCAASAGAIINIRNGED